MKNYTFVDQTENVILHRFVEYGNHKTQIVTDFPIRLFTEDKKPDTISLFGDKLRTHNFDTIKEAKDFIKTHKNVFGQTNFAQQFINENYPSDIKIDSNNFNIVYWDIETEVSIGFPHPHLASQPITAITLKSNQHKNFITIALGHFEPRDNIKYIQCSDEKDLLKTFIKVWNDLNPEIISGWNIAGFDVPYTINRIKKILGDSAADKLSPFNGAIKNVLTEVDINNKTKSYQIAGITIYDYIDLYKKFSLTTLESYTLNYVCQHELNEKKISYEESGSLMNLMNDNYEKFILYNIKDVELVESLENKLKFINIAVTTSALAKTRYCDVFSALRLWDSLLYNYLSNKGVQIPPTIHSGSFGIIGGYVKEPLAGLHKWVVSFDLASLYPSIIMGANLSPETMVTGAESNYSKSIIAGTFNEPDLKINNVSMTANGAKFDRKSIGLMPEITENIFALRKKTKSQMLAIRQTIENETDKNKVSELIKEEASLNALQQALKILLNSLYGSITNEHFRYSSQDISEGITSTGQAIIQFIERRVNEFLSKKFGEKDRVIASDTDSIFVNLEDFHKRVIGDKVVDIQKTVDIIDLFCKNELEPFIAQCFDEFTQRLNFYKNTLYMKREKIIDRGIWRAKKNYIIQVWDNEGVRYNKSKFVAVGVEIARSSTPSFIKEALKKSLLIILNDNNDDLQEFIKDFKVQFNKFPVEEIAFPRGVNDIQKWVDDSGNYKSGTPIHIRGSIMFNQLMKKHDLNKMYPLITDSTKIKFVYLKMPNPIQSNVVAFNDYMPPEFGLESYIDYETQFVKSFVSPVESFTKAIGWDIEKRNDLSTFFDCNNLPTPVKPAIINKVSRKSKSVFEF